MDWPINKITSLFFLHSTLFFFEDNVGWKIVFNEKSCVFLPLKKLDKVIDIFKNVTESDLYKNFNFFDLRIIGRIYMSKKEC